MPCTTSVSWWLRSRGPKMSSERPSMVRLLLCPPWKKTAIQCFLNRNDLIFSSLSDIRRTVAGGCACEWNYGSISVALIGCSHTWLLFWAWEKNFHLTHCCWQPNKAALWSIANVCVPDVTLPRLRAFIPQLLSRLHIEALLHGNITKEVCSFIVLLWKM